MQVLIHKAGIQNSTGVYIIMAFLQECVVNNLFVWQSSCAGKQFMACFKQ